MAQSTAPSKEDVRAAAQLLAQRSWNPLTSFKRSAAAKVLRELQIARSRAGRQRGNLPSRLARA